MPTLDLALPVLCGQLIVGGFAGPTLEPRFRKALADGHRGGAILFKRNVPDIEAGAPCAYIAARRRRPPPFIGSTGRGRVRRLRRGVALPRCARSGAR